MFKKPFNILYALFILGLMSTILYYFATHYPIGSYKYTDKNISIKISITSNLLVFKDLEVTKTLKIIDGEETYEVEFWSESKDLNLYKRKTNTEAFWVIEDMYREFSRSQSDGFSRFTCSDCSAYESMKGLAILKYEFRRDHWIKHEVLEESTLMSEQYIQNGNLLTRLYNTLSQNIHDSIFSLTYKPKLNKHNPSVVDTVKTFTYHSSNVYTYKSVKNEWIYKAKIVDPKVYLLSNISIGILKKDLQNIIDSPLKSNVIKIGDLEQNSVFTFLFKNDTLVRVEYNGYLG